jgi:hypothetical protein
MSHLSEWDETMKLIPWLRNIKHIRRSTVQDAKAQRAAATGMSAECSIMKDGDSGMHSLNSPVRDGQNQLRLRCRRYDACMNDFRVGTEHLLWV